MENSTATNYCNDLKHFILDLLLMFYTPPTRATSCGVISQLFTKYVGENISGIGNLAGGFESGRLALQFLLLHIKLLNPKRNIILLPEHCCRSVVDSILKCKLEIIYLKCNGPTYNVKADQIISNLNDKCLAFIAINSFGLCDESALAYKELKKNNVLLIMDLTWVFGSEYSNQLLKYESDYSYTSAGLGKTITLGGGGLVFIRDKYRYFQFLEDYSQLKNSDMLFLVTSILLQLVYPLVVSRYLYFALKTIKNYNVSLLNSSEKKINHLDTKIKKMPDWYLKNVNKAIRNFINKKKNNYSHLYNSLIDSNKYPHKIKCLTSSPKYPLFCSNVNIRNAIKFKLIEMGVDVSLGYDGDTADSTPANILNNLITLPAYSELNHDTFLEIIKIVNHA